MRELIMNECSWCHIKKEPGAIFYVVRVILTCDFDGELEDMDTEEIPAKIDEEIKKGLTKDEDELMAEVYQEVHLYLCQKCRGQFLKKLK